MEISVWILCFSSSSDKLQDLAISILQNHITTWRHSEYGPHFELLLLLFWFIFVVFFLQDRISLYASDCPGTCL